MSYERIASPLETTVPMEQSDSFEGRVHVEIVARERYSIGEEIAQGGIGRIWRANDKRLERQVALKQLLDPSPENEARFLREALVTAKLQHPSIVPVYDVGRFPDGEIFYAMKLVTGRSLGEIIEESSSFDKRLALLPHVIAVAEAIAYAHNERIVHRDLKPANVLIGPFGETVVIDWGIAKDLREQESAAAVERPVEALANGADTSNSLTMAGAVLGTPGYMPPEQAAGNPVDERADVYALGAILYHVLAGTTPYEGKSGLDILTRVLTEPPPELAQREPRVPRDLLAIVKKAMARDPRDRYPTAHELVLDLRLFQTGQIVGAYQYSRPERFFRFARKHRAVFATTVLGLLAVTLMGFTSLSRVVDARRVAESERDRANEERARAEEKQSEAEKSSYQALRQSDELLVLEARTAARHDPNAAIAWLSSLSSSFQRWGEARLIAADAREYGIAKILRGHTGALNMIAYSSDGSLLATTSDDRRIGLWTPEGKLVRMLEGHTDEVWRVFFMEGNRRLLSSSKDGTVRIWDVHTGETVRVVNARGAAGARAATLVDGEQRVALINCLSKRVEIHDISTDSVDTLPGDVDCPGKVEVSPDKHSIAYIVQGSPRLMNLNTRQFRDFTSKEGYCLLTHLSKDGQFLGCAGKSGYASLWEVKTGRQAEHLAPKTIPNFGIAHFSPDGDAFLFGRDSSLYVKNLRSGAIRSFEQHQGPMFAGTFSPDGRMVVTTSFDRSAILLDLNTETKRQHHGFRDTTSWAEFSPNQDAVAVASWDGTARIFPVAASRNRVVTQGTSPMKVSRFSEDGSSIVSLEKNGTVHIDKRDSLKTPGIVTKLEGVWHVLSPNAQLVAHGPKEGVVRIHHVGGNGLDVELEGRPGPVKKVIFSAQSDRLLIAGTDNTVRVWDLTSRQSHLVTTESASISSVAFSGKGQFVAVANRDGMVRVFPAGGGPGRTFTGHVGEVHALTFFADDNLLVSGGQDHRLCIWDLTTGQGRTIDASGMGIMQVVATRDGKTLYSLGSESAIRRWDVATGKELSILRGHRTMVEHIDLSPEGLRLISTGSNGDIRLWDLETGQSRMLEGHRQNVPWVLFAPDGKTFLSTSGDGTTRVWHDDLPFDGPTLRSWMAQMSPQNVDVSPIVN
ncbi:MAG TPA: protein kinase [Polyangium sp.]|nr:protein kinase [Polyangium sp.]